RRDRHPARRDRPADAGAGDARDVSARAPGTRERGGVAMARVLGGIGASHAPSMEHVYDRGEMETEEWQPLFGPFDEVRRWLERIRPDALFVIYNDHFDHFWLDAWPQFAIGVADRFPIADEGQGARD